MLKVIFTDGEKEMIRDMDRDEIDVLHIHKPKLDFDGDSWKIIDLRFNVESGTFTFWIETE